MRNPHECRALVNTAVRKVLNGNATGDAIRYAVLLSSSGNWTFADEGAHPAHVALGAELTASRTPDACNANLPTMNDSGTTLSIPRRCRRSARRRSGSIVPSGPPAGRSDSVVVAH